MKKTCISKDWYFKNVTQNTDYVAIDLPHDYQIKQPRDPQGNWSNGFFPDTSGRYVKHLSLEKGKHYILDLDGAYMCTHIMFNEQFLGMHPYGYTPYLVDLTPHVFDTITNKLIITTTPPPQSTRWYSGNGIYRDVFLWEGGAVRIEPWDLFISTVSASEQSATIRVKYTVSSDVDADASMRFSVQNTDGTVCEQAFELSVTAGKNEQEFLLQVPSPSLWDTEHPNLYTLCTQIIWQGETVDESETVFGVRTVTADAKNGLLLNGKPIKLRGGCVHHDHGELGAAAFPAAEYRKLSKLKQAGFNAIRCTHNPSSLAFLEACDRLGIIVMDEAFDCWNLGKNPFDYHIFFSDWWERDLSYMVLRDRNHPCVFSYSIGNEIWEINGTSQAAEISQKMSDAVRKYDDTKFVTAGIQKHFVKLNYWEDIDPEDYRAFIQKRFKEVDNQRINEIARGFEKPLDLVGGNYYFDRYALDHEMYPDRVLWGSETKAIKFFRSWAGARDNRFVLGDFTWTAYDNLGEAGAGRTTWEAPRDDLPRFLNLNESEYPWRNCYQGDLDLCGFRRPQSYFRESIWRADTQPRIFVTHPAHFSDVLIGTDWHWYDVDECWTYDDCYVGRPIRVETYTGADFIAWYVNGKEVGRSVPEQGIARLETVYEKGSIRAVAYRDGQAYSEYTLQTTDALSTVSVCAEKDHIRADGRDLCYLPISLTDAQGRLVVLDDREITCTVEGGELLAVFSGNPRSEDDVNRNRCHTFKGHALAILRAKAAGEITVTVCAQGLQASTVTIQAE
ncbi:MAG: DUF4982 domain-containing protein [Clostridia bacterium]|nr:DUF4982 domain-containing protein [Clostridia bacterium]